MLSSVLLLALTGAALSGTAMTGTHALQPPGMFHDGEAVARHGDRWLALRVHDGDARLRMTRLRVKRVFDVITDAEGETTGHEIESDVGDVVTYLRGPGLHAGPVAVAVSEYAGEGPLPTQRLRLGDRVYRLLTRCTADAVNTAQDGMTYRCRIELSEDGKDGDVERGPRQTLTEMTGNSALSAAPDIVLGDDASPHVIFAGDLDRDGRLDLIFDTSDHYNRSHPVLFLSGAAEGEELLHAVAEHDAVGC
ncbi:MAG: VCBS repeat-containing protein [Lysobacter sp.]|nr:VCBS repeat-containing protein [Lysobacter sp.]